MENVFITIQKNLIQVEIRETEKKILSTRAIKILFYVSCTVTALFPVNYILFFCFDYDIHRLHALLWLALFILAFIAGRDHYYEKKLYKLRKRLFEMNTISKK